MDRGKLKIAAKAKASSILEVVVAMVIIVIVFGIAMMIYTNVLQLAFSGKKMKAEAVLQEALLAAQQDVAIESKTFRADDLSVNQYVAPAGGSAKLFQLTLTAIDINGDTVAKARQLIVKADE